MAKYAICKEGAEALNQLANNLLIDANNIVEANARLEQITLSLEEGLGIYGDEIISIIHKNRQTLNRNKDQIVALAQKVKKQAQDIESLLTKELGEVDDANHHSRGSNTNSGIHMIPTGAWGGMERPDRSLSSESYKSICHTLDRKKVEHNAIKKFGKERSSKEIVERLGGGDNTKGSCSSLALAYVGNKAGYDVLDFRDGKSRKYFSKNSSIEKITMLPNVDAKIIRGRDDIDCADRLLSEMEENKEYYLATGEHAAIVRLINGHYEYLELQTSYNNGWHLLHDTVLNNRFRCDVGLFESSNFLINIESLLNCNEFLDLLGYINTAECEQRKGDNGYAR